MGSYPEMDKLLKICQIFECSLDDLVQGDLTQREPEAQKAMPSGMPKDVCGYDDHQRMLAWKIPTGIAAILIFVGVALLLEGTIALSEWNGKDGLFVILVLTGTLIGLAFLIPAGMAHSAFVKAHPYIEDFYTEEDKTQARNKFTYGLIGGIACIFVGIGCMLMLESNPDTEGMSYFFPVVLYCAWCMEYYSLWHTAWSYQRCRIQQKCC